MFPQAYYFDAYKRQKGLAKVRKLSGLPLLDVTGPYTPSRKSCQFWDIPKLESVWETLRGMSAVGHQRPHTIVSLDWPLPGTNQPVSSDFSESRV